MGFNSKRDSFTSDVGCGRIMRNFIWLDVNPLTTLGRSFQLLGLIVLPMLPLLGLVGYCGNNVVKYSNDISDLDTISEHIETRISILPLMLALQRETAMVTTFYAANQTDVLGSFDEHFHQTDILLATTNVWPDVMGSKSSFLDRHNDHRDGNVSTVVDPEQILDKIDHYYNHVNMLLSWQTEDMVAIASNGQWKFAFSLFNLLNSVPHIGMCNAISSLYYIYGQLPQVLLQRWVSCTYLAAEYMEKSLTYWAKTQQLYTSIIHANSVNVHKVLTTQNEVFENEAISPNFIQAYLIYRLLDYRENLIHELIIQVFKHGKEDLKAEKLDVATDLVIDLAGLIIGLTFIVFIALSGYRSTSTLYIYAICMEKRTLELRHEKRKIDNILSKMLPKAVAYRLKQRREVAAEEFESVTVFFSDIVDFNELSAHSSPMQIVDFLNEVYTFMDKQMVEYDVYKVETIGCVYMVASGLPSRNKNRHVSEIARMSLDLLQATERLTTPQFRDTLQLRIGFHTGPVVAGVVGNKAPRYCLFGDTVNTASRMQSSGQARKIHISSDSRALLVQNGGFELTERGAVDIKGKGCLKTFWLVGRLELSREAMSLGSELASS